MMDRKLKIKWSTAAGIGCAAFAVRVIYVLQSSGSDPTFTVPLMDARLHLQWGMGLAQGNMPGDEVFFRAPLYPYFLGLLLWIFGPDFTAVKIVQAVLGSITAALIYGLGDRLGGKRTGIVAGIMAALYGPLVFFDGELLIPVLFLPLTAGSLLLSLRAMEEGRTWRWVLAGFILGMCAIARPNVLVFAPVLMAWMAWEIKDRRLLAQSAGVWLLAFLLPVMAVSVRNKIAGGEFVLIASQGGVNFYIGNNPQSDGKTAMAPAHYGPAAQSGGLYHDSVQVNARMEAEHQLKRKLGHGEVSAYWFGRGFAFIGTNPGAWIKLTLKKIYYLANGHEIPSNRQIYRVGKWSSLLGLLMIRDPIGLPYGLLFPLAMAGIALGFRREDKGLDKGFKPLVSTNGATYRLLLLFTITYAATVIAFFVTGRHRIPMVIGLIPLAAYAAVKAPAILREAMREVSRKKAIAVLSVFIAALIISNTRFAGVRDDVTREFYMGMGEVYGQLGRFEEALEEFDAAIAEEPNLDRAWFNKGAALVELGRYDEALAAFSRTLLLQPKFAPAWSHIGNVYMAKGYPAEAEDSYRRALLIDPNLAIAHSNLALVLFKKGDRAGYVSELEAAVRADPFMVPANINLAQHYIATGRSDKARPLLMNVLRVDQNNRKAIDFLRSIGK